MASVTSRIKPKISGFSYRSLSLAITMALSTATQAATYTVSNTNDSGAGSLRQAVLNANATTVADVINFSLAPGSTVNLSGSELLITQSLTIAGSGIGNPNSVTINGAANSRILHATIPSTGHLTLENLTLTNGNINGRGGGIRMGGTGTHSLTLNNTVVTGNSTSGYFHEGGGLYVDNTNITLNNSVISNNTTSGDKSPGGGIFANEVTITLNNSTISGNTTTGNQSPGGGLYSDGATTFNQSTISNNHTSGNSSHGGGLYIYLDSALNQSAIFNQSTISGNTTTGSSAHGGGLAVFKGDTILNNSTITNNSSTGAGGGFFALIQSYSIFLNNTVLSANTGFLGNFYGATPSTGKINADHSLFGDSASEITGTNIGNIFTNTPNLGVLQNNGGITLTHKPNPGSLALDAGNNTKASAFSLDQRNAGFYRIQNTIVDIGSVEKQVEGPPPPPSNSKDNIVTRAEISKPLLLAKHGASYVPPAATGTRFADVAVNQFNAAWVEQLKVQGITEGCASNAFCPDLVVTKEQLAKILLKTKYGVTYVPSPASGNIFADVSVGSFAADWIEALSADGISSGCASNRYCPKATVTIDEFETLLNKTFP